MAAASTQPNEKYSEKKSYVAKDLIWKDHISKIDTAQKFHEKRWGFLNDSELQNALYDPKRLTDSSLSTDRSCSRIHDKYNEDKIKQDVTVTPSPRPVPMTTNKLIGWRTADKSCNLERYGKYARGQESLHKKFKWPVEGFD